MKKYLIIIPVGNSPLPIDFTDKSRHFDLCTIYYNEGDENRIKSISDYYFQLKGPKWFLVKNILNKIDWMQYEYIWIIDDDLEISIKDINELFNIASTNKLTLCQPSVKVPDLPYKKCQELLKLLNNPKDEYTYASLYDLRKKYPEKANDINKLLYRVSYPVLVRKFDEHVIRSVDLIEIQMPLLSRNTLKLLYKFICSPITNSGFGQDILWAKIIPDKYVIDWIEVAHLRDTQFMKYEKALKGLIPMSEVSEQYQHLKTNPRSETNQLLEEFSLDKITINNEAFEIYIDEDECKIIHDFGGYETRNESMIIMINDVYNKLLQKNMKGYKIEAVIYTGDKYKEDIRVKTSLAMAGNKEEYDNLLPSFVFHDWRQVNIHNYTEKINSIVKASKIRWSDKRIFWIGNPQTNPLRWRLIDYSKKHPDKTLFESIKWIPNNNDDMSKTTSNFVSLEDHTKFQCLFDAIPNGYSGRIPLLLATGRPVMIQHRKIEQWYFYNNTFIPWTHYIPVKEDLSDLDTQVNWLFNNPEKAEQIGKAGQQYVLQYLSYDKILDRFYDVLISKKQTINPLDKVYAQINSDALSFNYTSNLFTKIDIAIASTFKLNHHILKLQIYNNKIKILHYPKAYERRADGWIKIVESALKYGKIRDTILYFHVADEYIYQYPELPFMVIAKPEDKKGILTVDHSFVDIEPESKTANDKNTMIDWNTNLDIINKKCTHMNKENKIFFIGQNIEMKKTTFNMRKWIHDNQKKYDIPLDIKLTDISGYFPMSDFCKYKYLLNLPGMSPWSFRKKFLFLMNSMIIDVTVLRKYSNSYDKKWINIFDSLFVPNKDYIEIEYEYSDKENQENNLKNLMNKIKYVYDKFEKDNDLYNKIVKRGNEKGLLINDDTIQEISFNIISKYASNMINTSPHFKFSEDFILKYDKFDYTKLNGKYGKIGQIEYKQIGKGVQGSAYLCISNKFKWITKVTKLNFGKYDSYREIHFSEMTNKIVQYGGFLEYYDTKFINNNVYMSMEACEGDLINWSMHNRTEEDWLSLIYQIVIAVNRLQKLKIIHNDLQAKNILFNNKVSTMIYKIGNNKYSFKSKFNFYIIDFGISAHPDLEINLINREQMKRSN